MPGKNLNIMVWNVREMGQYLSRCGDACTTFRDSQITLSAYLLATLIQMKNIDVAIILEVKKDGVKVLNDACVTLNRKIDKAPYQYRDEEWVPFVIPASNVVSSADRMQPTQEAYGLLVRKSDNARITEIGTLELCRQLTGTVNQNVNPRTAVQFMVTGNSSDLDGFVSQESTPDSLIKPSARFPFSLPLKYQGKDLRIVAYHGPARRNEEGMGQMRTAETLVRENEKAVWGGALACHLQALNTGNVILTGDFNITTSDARSLAFSQLPKTFQKEMNKPTHYSIAAGGLINLTGVLDLAFLKFQDFSCQNGTEVLDVPQMLLSALQQSSNPLPVVQDLSHIIGETLRVISEAARASKPSELQSALSGSPRYKAISTTYGLWNAAASSKWVDSSSKDVLVKVFYYLISDHLPLMITLTPQAAAAAASSGTPKSEGGAG